MVLGSSVTVVAVLPQFLAGAMAVQITEDLRFGVAGLGLAVAMFRMTQILTSVPLGRLADRLGAVRSMRAAAAVALVASIGIALTAQDLLTLSAWMVFASCANALGQPAANRLLVHRVPTGRLGFAFGLKQAATPTASMLSGFAVPVIALNWGWRWGYAVGALMALVVIVAVGRRPPVPAAQRPGPGASKPRLENRRVVVLLAAAFGCALLAISVVPTFFVAAAVEAGVSLSRAGVYLAAGSASAVIVRLIAGHACDRIVVHPLRLASFMIATGSVGIGMLALMRPWAMAVGVILALGGAWGFNGVFWYALVGAYRGTPGRITGAMNPGGFAGATLGTLGFGVVAETLSYTVAWGIAGVIGLVGATAIGLGGRLLASAPRVGGPDPE